MPGRFFDCLTARGDELFELPDTLLCADGPATAPIDLTLLTEYQFSPPTFSTSIVRGSAASLGLLRGTGRRGGCRARRTAAQVTQLAARLDQCLNGNTGELGFRNYTETQQLTPTGPIPSLRKIPRHCACLGI